MNNPRQIVVSLLVAVGLLTVVRDLLRFADSLRLAAELDEHPERLHEEIAEHLREEEEA